MAETKWTCYAVRPTTSRAKTYRSGAHATEQETDRPTPLFN